MKKSIAFYLMILFFAILFAYAFGMKAYKENVNNHALEVQEELEELWVYVKREALSCQVNRKCEEMLDEKYNNEGYKIDFIGKNDDQNAKRIFWEWTMHNTTHQDISYMKQFFRYDMVYAFFFDLDDDGIDEIIGEIAFIGLCDQPHHCPGCSIFILKKTEKDYALISELDSCHIDAIILKNKTNGYHNIKMYVPDQSYYKDRFNPIMPTRKVLYCSTEKPYDYQYMSEKVYYNKKGEN